MEFKIIKKSKKSNARLGVIKTKNGTINTPCFVRHFVDSYIPPLFPYLVV